MLKKLIVVKVGTSSLTNPDGSVSEEKIENITNQLCRLKDLGHSIILVSSGAIGAGFGKLGFTKRPTSIADKQAAAAVGQGLLMQEYTKHFSENGIVCAQLLLTQGDFADRRRYKNIFSSISVLLSRGAVPVINENDTVAIEELKLGDNDTLSAQVAAMIHSNLLILLTDIDGLYTANPKVDENAKHIDVVDEINDSILNIAGDAMSGFGTGGMHTKIKGAQLATSAGVPVVICASYEEDSIVKAVDGNAKGTTFKAKSNSIKTRQQWMAFYAHSCGNIYIDEGAAMALIDKEKSLLVPGITAIEGDFKEGDVVSVFKRGSHEYLGKGIINYSHEDLYEMIDRNLHNTEAINRNNWVGSI